MSSISIGGVPEHFNLPWKQAMLHDAFSQAGVDVAWTYYSGGTGALTEALNSGVLDMAILLTEGYLFARSSGLDARIVKVFIDTPLVWGIYTADPNVHSAGQPGMRYAISRHGSGSHLMAMIHAEQRNEILSPEYFLPVQSLDRAIQSLVKLETSYFYWEKYMTRPFVNQGLVRMIGEFSAPWSSFLIVASERALQKKSWSIRMVLEIMNARCRNFTSDPQVLEMLIHNFHMSAPEARQWLMDTQWNTTFTMPLNHIERARKALAGIGKCDPELKPADCKAEWLEFTV